MKAAQFEKVIAEEAMLVKGLEAESSEDVYRIAPAYVNPKCLECDGHRVLSEWTGLGSETETCPRCNASHCERTWPRRSRSRSSLTTMGRPTNAP